MSRQKKSNRQNRSQAVMADRSDPIDSLDYYPTHPWATRALIEHVMQDKSSLKNMSCWEPACGEGHMSKVLCEYFKTVRSSDVFDYGYGSTFDFLTNDIPAKCTDWVITNFPFAAGHKFIVKALSAARVGVAVLARTVFVESGERWEQLFKPVPPNVVAPFVERVPLLKGRLSEKASTATSYSWFVWDTASSPISTKLSWIAPCRNQLKRDGDYDPVM
jgi:hypothetical protein